MCEIPLRDDPGELKLLVDDTRGSTLLLHNLLLFESFLFVSYFDEGFFAGTDEFDELDRLVNLLEQ